MQTTCEPLPRTRNHGEAHKMPHPRSVVLKSAPARPHEPRERFIVNAAPGKIQRRGAKWPRPLTAPLPASGERRRRAIRPFVYVIVIPSTHGEGSRVDAPSPRLRGEVRGGAW